MKNLNKLFTVIGVIAVGGLVLMPIIKAISKKINISFGQPSFNYSFLLSANPFLRVNWPLIVNNQNKAGLTINDFSGKLYYGNVYLSDINLPLPSVIPASGTGTLYLEFDVYATQLITDLIQNITNQGAYNTILNQLRVKGYLSTNLGAVPINQPISLV